MKLCECGCGGEVTNEKNRFLFNHHVSVISSKLYNTELFIKKAKEIHGDLFNYSETVYVNQGIKVKIICKIHGIFEQFPNNHLAGSKCSKCRKGGKHKPHKKLSEEYKASLKGLNKGNKNPNWKGGRFVDGDGYILIYIENHPYSRGNFILEHRFIMEQHIGRYLTKDEVVHHINGIKDDNRIENLELMTNSSHVSAHAKELYDKSKFSTSGFCWILNIKTNKSKMVKRELVYNYLNEEWILGRKIIKVK
jgi:hypothetical protein